MNKFVKFVLMALLCVAMYHLGVSNGKSVGYEKGYSEGEEIGLKICKVDAIISERKAVKGAYNKGLVEGFIEGLEDGYIDGLKDWQLGTYFQYLRDVHGMTDEEFKKIPKHEIAKMKKRLKEAFDHIENKRGHKKHELNDLEVIEL